MFWGTGVEKALAAAACLAAAVCVVVGAALGAGILALIQWWL